MEFNALPTFTVLNSSGLIWSCSVCKSIVNVTRNRKKVFDIYYLPFFSSSFYSQYGVLACDIMAECILNCLIMHLFLIIHCSKMFGLCLYSQLMILQPPVGL